MRQSHKTILLWLLLILMFVSIYQLFTGPSKAGDEKIAFGSFMQEVQNNPAHIKKVTIKGETWTDGPDLRPRNTNDIISLALKNVGGDLADFGAGGSMALDLLKVKGTWAVSRSSSGLSGPIISSHAQYFDVAKLLALNVGHYDCAKDAYQPLAPPEAPDEK